MWSLGCVWFCLLQCETLESRYRRNEFVLRSMGDKLKEQAVGHLIEEYSKCCAEKEEKEGAETVSELFRAMLKWDHRLESPLHLSILPRFLAAAKVLRPSRVCLIRAGAHLRCVSASMVIRSPSTTHSGLAWAQRRR